MFRRNQNEDESEILAVPSDEILTVTQDDDITTLPQPSLVRCLAQRDKLSEGTYILRINAYQKSLVMFEVVAFISKMKI